MVECELVIRRAAADERDSAAGHGNRVRRIEAGRVPRRVKAEVIERQGALGEEDARRAGNRATIDELQRAAEHRRFAAVIAGCGQGRGGITCAEEVKATRDATCESTGVARAERGTGQSRDGAAHARQRIGAGKTADGLILGADVEDGARAVEGDDR